MDINRNHYKPRVLPLSNELQTEAITFIGKTYTDLKNLNQFIASPHNSDDRNIKPKGTSFTQGSFYPYLTAMSLYNLRTDVKPKHQPGYLASALIGSKVTSNKDDFTYKNGVFRTPYINENLIFNSLILNQIGLLEIEQPYHFEKLFSSGGETVNPLEHLRELLRIIRDIYKNKDREV